MSVAVRMRCVLMFMLHTRPPPIATIATTPRAHLYPSNNYLFGADRGATPRACRNRTNRANLFLCSRMLLLGQAK